jgi:hypothetical protein
MKDTNLHFRSPNEFYRTQRPERFSDSVRVDKPSLDRSQLEYYLATITNRSQETDFEHLARGLAERRIAPNLIPHTGPTGGGDSKVDSETFPVADALALAWYEGIGRAASKERWGFAFSAKKDWRPKLKGDIAKLVGTGRGYEKAFFVTNQYVRDKDRAILEDELSKEHGIEVRILDLNWVLDSVFTGRHETFAIDTLGLSPELRPEIRLGPHDTAREERLAELERRILEAVQAGRLDTRVVDDALRAATTARGLERPRADIDGRFLRARELAERLKSSARILRINYQWAWTAFFWYEDFARFVTLARESFDIALRSENSFELELATTLLGLARTAIAQSNINAREFDFDDHASRLLDALDKVGANEDHPSNALHAQTLAIQTRLLLAPDDAEPLLAQMLGVIEKAQFMIGYPFEQTADLIGALEPFLGDVDAYGSLFERIVEITGKRQGDVTAAQMLLKRGAQQLERNDNLNAIRTVGRVLGRLYKHESRDDLIQALFLAGHAYSRVGLLWAARGSLIVAASLATDEFHKFGRLTRGQVACYDRLRWLELELGRMPQLLEWHHLAALASQAAKVNLAADAFDMFDAVLGIEILRTDVFQLAQLVGLPDVLDDVGLYMSRSALLFSLGHPSELPDDLFRGEDRSTAELEFMRQWRDQPASRELRSLSLGSGDQVTLESNVLGCHVELTSDNKAPAIDLAESLLASLESLLSTGLDARMVGREPLLRISVRVTEFAQMPFSFRLEHELGRPHFYVGCRRFEPDSLSHEEQSEVKRRLVDLLIQMFAHIVATPDDAESVRKLFVDEHALERAVNFTNVFVSLGNVLGHKPKLSIGVWTEKSSKTYPMIRETKWDAMDVAAGEQLPQSTATSNDSPAGIPEFGTPAKHSQLRTVSLIREKLWNEAGWTGAGYFSVEGNSIPPTLALLFRNPKVGIEIFEAWQEELGSDSLNELLRISIIRGISASHPAHYRMVIGTEFEALKGTVEPLKDRVVMVSRIHTMEPQSSENLDRFLQSYVAAGSFILAPGILDTKRGPRIGHPQLIKRTIHVRDAWEIGRHDPDVPAIDIDDDVVVPNEKENVPVKEVLEWLRGR